MLKRLRALPSFRPGIAYVLDTLYLAPTARSPAAHTMRSVRGPRFAAPDVGLAPLPKSRTSQQTATSAGSGFEPLPAGAAEPSAEELARLVDEFFAAAAAPPLATASVVWQGDGDPLEAASVVVDTVAACATGVDFRLNTLGLCDAAAVDRLLASGVLARGWTPAVGQPRGSRIASVSGVSVFLPAADPAQYAELLRPREGRGLPDACAFVSWLAEEGVAVEVTAVARPDVDVDAIEALALELGASSFRTWSWLGD